MKITDIHILAIMVRIFAIYLLVNALINVTNILFSIAQQSWTGFSFTYLIYPGSIFLLALFLLLFPMTVAKGIIPYKNGKKMMDILPAQHLFCIAITILGIYFLVDALVNLFYWVFLWVNYSSSSIEFLVTLEQKGGTVATIAELALSLVLIFSSNKITSFIFSKLTLNQPCCQSGQENSN